MFGYIFAQLAERSSFESEGSAGVQAWCVVFYFNLDSKGFSFGMRKRYVYFAKAIINWGVSGGYE